MKDRKTRLVFLLGNLALVVALAAFLLAPLWNQGVLRRFARSTGYTQYLAGSLTARAAGLNPWTVAVEKVKEDRGEATGKQAQITIPSELRHYSDTRRFLATQVAEVRQHQLESPQDFVDVARMIGTGELVAVRPVTENYILLGVGGSADKDPFARYENGKSISLYNEAALRQEYADIAAARVKLADQAANLRQEMAALKKRDRSRRAGLRAQIATAEKSLKAASENRAMLDRHYGAPEKRQQLFGYYESLASLGRNLPERTFDIADASSRRDLKVRLLSTLRPEAMKVMDEIASSYRERFNRPLPITSLVRPDEYQHDLSKTNPNATLIETPPHSTGLAFDILYRFMSAGEQAHLMAHLAELKDAGRIEVLRENRDHYHVFAFVDGLRPREDFISASLGEVRPGKASTARPARQAIQTHHATKSSTRKSTKQKHPVQRTKRRR